MNTIIFPTVEQLMDKIAEELISYSNEGDIVNIGLSGGNTPKKLFMLLSSEKYNIGEKAIKWANLHFWWCDERLVPPSSNESNFGIADSLLFSKINIPKTNIHRIRGEAANPSAEASRYAAELEQNLTKIDGIASFDWVLLGAGNDGHTASLFPGFTDFSDKSLVITAQNPHNNQNRISLSAKTLTNAMRVTFVVTGDDKAKLIQEIYENQTTTYPAGKIKSITGTTEWFLDGAAGQYIK